ncbi:hypothetical protein AZ78_4085 [Lysobacter capsici AZ78]|uniref:Uncharacterized protein n=1 Tax=Lysobacter capsici AZ78 TaxID=1444315 RepID=A0A108UCN9_9GAMM|nr:hypothetical protein AZ78_4085 [Lysobacter capsici AZ78]
MRICPAPLPLAASEGSARPRRCPQGECGCERRRGHRRDARPHPSPLPLNGRGSSDKGELRRLCESFSRLREKVPEGRMRAWALRDDRRGASPHPSPLPQAGEGAAINANCVGFANPSPACGRRCPKGG